MARIAADVKGVAELQKRLGNIATVFKPIGRKWQTHTINSGRQQVPVLTGRLRKSLRRGGVSKRGARVNGHFTAYFVDKGPAPHIIKAKRARGLVFKARDGRTIFTRQVNHRGYRGRPFRLRIAREGLRKTDLPAEVVKLWNEAA